MHPAPAMSENSARKVIAPEKDGPDMTEHVTAATLKIICRRLFRMTIDELSSRTKTLEALSQQNLEIQELVNSEIRKEIAAGNTKYSKKRKSPPESETVQSKAGSASVGKGSNNQKKQKTYNPPNSRYARGITGIGPLKSSFMLVPSEETLKRVVKEFIDATGNDALKTVPCASCARQFNASKTVQFNIEDIPNRERLKPAVTHPKHNMYDGSLLYPGGIESNGKANICNECNTSLSKDKIPRFSLANGMWVGNVPSQLKNMTLPERVMIAKHFPSAYIIKLFPKKRGATAWDKNQMHRALKGNVSTYKMDPAQLAGMIDGQDMPHRAIVLSATIGVTFIRPTGGEEGTMPSMFRVRRWKVREALIWLKANNPLYADINISEDRLMELPEDGIPEELSATAKVSNDVAAVDRERESYVPDEEDEGNFVGKLAMILNI